MYILKSFIDRDSRTSVRFVRWLLAVLHFYMFRDRHIVHFCLFREAGAFILASTLVPEMDLEAQRA